MIKSEERIEQDVYDVLKDEIKGLINGDVYKSGCRPIDSENEDAVITVSNASGDQIQVGHVLINIYVPDIDNGSGSIVPNKSRLRELSDYSEYLIDTLNECTTDEYTFYPGKATKTYDEPDILQHRASMDIEFQRITFND